MGGKVITPFQPVWATKYTQGQSGNLNETTPQKLKSKVWLETQCSSGTCLACAPLELHYYKSKEHKAGTAYSTAIRMSDHKVSISREHNALQSSLETSHAHFKWPKMIVFLLNYLRTVHTSIIIVPQGLT